MNVNPVTRVKHVQSSNIRLHNTVIYQPNAETFALFQWLLYIPPVFLTSLIPEFCPPPSIYVCVYGLRVILGTNSHYYHPIGLRDGYFLCLLRCYKLISSFFIAGSHFAVSRSRGVAPGIKLHHSDPSMQRRIKIFRPIEQIFEPYRMMFRKMKEKSSSSHHSVSAKKIKTQTGQ